jgi:archaeal flagellar protein FlaF
MAAAGIIGTAVGIILLIVVAYVVVGATLTAAETVSNAQKDVTLQNQMRIGTAFTISDQIHNSSIIYSNVTNTGTEIIRDFNHMDILVYDQVSNDYQVCIYNDIDTGTPGTWYISEHYQDYIHPSELDPGEKYQFRINTIGTSPEWFQITSGNGVYASAFV